LRADDLQRAFFAPYWDDIVLGRTALLDCLRPVLEQIAPHLTPEQLIDYWFEQYSRLDDALLRDMAALRSAVHWTGETPLTAALAPYLGP
jgi:putative hydrolase of the HAD superfamily